MAGYYKVSEARPGERFMANQTGEFDAEMAAIPGLRLGNIALDIDGKKIRDSNCHPIFATESAANQWNAIMERRFSAICRG